VGEGLIKLETRIYQTLCNVVLLRHSHYDLDKCIADLECMVGRMAMELEMVKNDKFYGTTTGAP